MLRNAIMTFIIVFNVAAFGFACQPLSSEHYMKL